MVVAAVQPADLARIDHHGRASDRFVDRLDNRRAIDERLHEKTARERRYGQPALGSDDRPDDFKAINDRYGHSAGRRHASRVRRAITRSVRSIDVPGRYGGEEFLVILPETAITGAATVAERIRDAVEQMGMTTASVGLADLIAEDTTGAELVVRADAALYKAKRTGKNRVVLAG